MTAFLQIQGRLLSATGLAEVLDVAYDAFEQMLLAVEAWQDPGSGLFCAFVMAGASAADGRDAVGFAPSLPLLPGAGSHADQEGVSAGDSAEAAAGALARLSRLLAACLIRAREWASDPGDWVACGDAARYAEEIHGLLRGGGS